MLSKREARLVYSPREPAGPEEHTLVSVFVSVNGIDTGYPGSVKVWKSQHVVQEKSEACIFATRAS
jgi:hypothetical protein